MIGHESPPLIPGLKTNGALAGRYRVEELLGAGRTGLVVAARHVYSRKRVTLKLLTGKSGAQPLAGAQKAVGLAGEHVAKIVDTGFTSDGVPFIATERVDGRTLRAEMDERGRLPYDEAVRCIVQACEGLAAAHSAGIVHGALKPSNLFVAEADGNVKILDFGMPGPEDGDAAWFASPAYLAPEQVSGAASDARADVWALGVILYELLAGRLPFSGETVTAMLVAVATEEPAALGDVPAKLAGVVMACLAKDPAARIGDVRALARELAPYAGTEGTALARRASTRPAAEVDEVAEEDGGSPESSAMTVPIPAAPAASRPTRSLRNEVDPPLPIKRAGGPFLVAFVCGALIALVSLWAFGAPSSLEKPASEEPIGVLAPGASLEPMPFVPHTFVEVEEAPLPSPRRAEIRRDDRGFTHPARLR